MHDHTRKTCQILASPRGHWACLCAIGLLVSLGCGHGDGGRIPIEGTVTLDGQPLKDGTIQFRPLAGTNGPTAGAQIVDGKFVVPAHGAPFVGKFRVEITSVRLTGQKVPNPMGSGMIDERKQFLAPRYNSDSQLQTEITAAGPNQCAFALTSDTEQSLQRDPNTSRK